jgi:hypothetical protein
MWPLHMWHKLSKIISAIYAYSFLFFSRNWIFWLYIVLERNYWNITNVCSSAHFDPSLIFEHKTSFHVLPNHNSQQITYGNWVQTTRNKTSNGRSPIWRLLPIKSAGNPFETTKLDLIEWLTSASIIKVTASR